MIDEPIKQDFLIAAISGATKTYLIREYKETYKLTDKEINKLISDPGLNLKPSFINYEKFYNLVIPSTAKRIKFPFTQIYIQDNFLSEENCEIAIKQMCEELVPSTVANEDDDIVHSDYRTSSTSGFDYKLSDVGTDLNEVIANYMGLDCLLAEWVQAQRYLPGEFYKAHHDYFPRFTTEYKIYTEWMGQRTWTFMVYLNDVEEGGETYFKHLNLKIKPKKGTAIFWNNLYKNGWPNYKTLHEALPPISGNKYIITKWFRSWPLLKMTD